MDNQIGNVQPAISVVMSVYKEPIEWLECSINSILNQTFFDYEFIIVVDDPDNQEAINYIRKKAEEDKRILLLVNEKNVGLTKSLNKGLKIAKGKYIARMDADDISHLDRFEKQFTFMESHPQVIICGASIHYFGGIDKEKIIIYPSTNDEIKAEMLFNSGLAHPTLFIRHQILQDNKICYDEAYRQTQDYRLYETLYDYGEYATVPEILLEYRVSKEQISNRLHGRQIGNTQQIRRRMINKWLLSIGYHELNFDNNVSPGLIRKEVLKIIHDKKNVYFRSLMKTLYFTNVKCKLRLLVKSIFNGDFFLLSKKDKLSYIGIVLGKVKPILL